MAMAFFSLPCRIRQTHSSLGTGYWGADAPRAGKSSQEEEGSELSGTLFHVACSSARWGFLYSLLGVICHPALASRLHCLSQAWH